MALPRGCFMFDGKVSSWEPSKLPAPDGAIAWEVRVHLVRWMGLPVYYMEALSPTAILAKVEDNQEEVRRVISVIKDQARVVQSFCALLELIRHDSLLPLDR